MKTLIILHGWQSSKEKWQKVKQALESNELKVIVPDIPGFKKEMRLNQAWNLNDYIEWFKNFSLSKEKFYILGHSFGSRIAIKFAIKEPEKVRALILVSAAGIKQKKSLKRILLFKIAKLGNKFSSCPCYCFVRKVFYRIIVRKSDYLDLKGSIKGTFKRIIEEDLTPYLSQIKVPVLIIWGEKDKITPLKDGYLMKEKIKNSKIEILKGIKHSPHLEAAELLSKKVLYFLASFD